MNAIYARQSVDRADSISIESQIEFCQYEMRGEQYKVYTDRGYSGKNTDRPAFAEMMNDIENGVIGKVVVYKLDRISRSILDFSNMMEQFGKHKVEFVSTTEKFNTSFPYGARYAQHLHRIRTTGTGNHSKACGRCLLLPQSKKFLYGRQSSVWV